MNLFEAIKNVTNKGIAQSNLYAFDMSKADLEKAIKNLAELSAGLEKALQDKGTD